MKTCFKCGVTKPLSEFYKNKAMADGHLNKCKDCTKRDSTANRDANIERARARDRERAKLPHRRKKITENTKRYRQENPQRYKCNTAVNNALRDGRLHKLPCWVCGSENVEAHHPDYDAPLSVVWLCAEHHKEIHLKHPR